MVIYSWMMSSSPTSYVYQYDHHLLPKNPQLGRDRWRSTIYLHLYVLLSRKWILLWFYCSTLIFSYREINFFGVYLIFSLKKIESSSLSFMNSLIRAILNWSVKICNMLTLSLLSWSLRSWYRTDVKLFGIRLYKSYDIILLGWSDFKRKWDQYQRSLIKADDMEKELNRFEMRTSHVTLTKSLESWKIFCVIDFFYTKSSEYDICMINFGSREKRDDFESFFLSWSCQI